MKKFIGFLFFLVLALALVWGVFRMFASPETRAAIAAIPTPAPEVVEVQVPYTVTVTSPITVTVPYTVEAPAVLTDTEGTQQELSRPAEDMGEWLATQKFVGPLCDPATYLGWVENPNDGFVPTGGTRAKYDLVLKKDEIAVAWGSDVTVGDKVYGRSVVTFYGPGRWSGVYITDGAYRKGYDEWEMFPEYMREVLICLYKGDWPLATAE